MAVRVGIVLLIAYNLVIGLWLALAPHSFYTALGPFGTPNTHYLRDNATFNLALAATFAVSLRRPAWRAPLVSFAALQFVLHALNHLNDIGAARPRWVGVFDFVSLAVSAVGLAWLAYISSRRPMEVPE